MKRGMILLALSLFLCSTASAYQGGGGEPTKTNPSTKKKPPVTKSGNTKPVRPPASAVPTRTQPTARPPVRATAELTIRSTPPNSLILIDGESIGITDEDGSLILPSFKPGKYTISVSKTGYLPSSKEIALSAGRKETLVFELAIGTQALSIVSSPPECEVYVDDVRRGSTDAAGKATFADVAVGEHRITIRKSRYRDVTFPLSLASDKEGQITANLEMSVGFLTVTTNVPNAGIDVSGIGHYNNSISKVEVPTGTYAITIASPLYVSSKREITVTPGQEAQLSVTMEVDSAARDRLVRDAKNAFSRDDFGSFRTLAVQAIRAGGSLEFELAHNDNWVGKPLHPVKLAVSATNIAFDPQVAQELNCSFRKFNLPIGTLLDVQVEETGNGIFSKPAGTYLKLVLQNSTNAKKPYTLNFADRGSSIVNDGRGHTSLNSRSNARQALSELSFVINVAMRSAR